MRLKFPKTVPEPADRGFTLLETLIAMAILAVALVAAFRLHYQSIAVSAEITFRANAPFLAGQLLSDLEREGIDGATTRSGTFAEGLPPYSWRMEVAAVDLPTAAASPPQLWQIAIDIAADERLRYQVNTFRRHQE